MKNRLNIAALAILAALWGCARLDVVPAPEKAITFEVGGYAVQTKSESVVPEFQEFSTKAWLYAQGVSGAQDFFGASGERITWDGSSEWFPSHVYYWPKSSLSYINFVSWHDANGAPSTVSETTMAWNERTIAPDDNIVWADAAWHFNDNAATYLYDGVTGGVPTLFHHALARVRFQAKATPLSEGNTTWSVTLREVVLNNVYHTGSLSLTNADPGTRQTRAWWRTGSAAGTAPRWNTSGSAGTISGDSSSFTLTQDNVYVPIIDTRSVLPQSTSGMVLTFVYDIRTDYDATGTNYTIEKVQASINLSEFSGSTGEWKMNYETTYNIIINPKTNLIRFDPSCTEWQSDPNNKMYIE